MKTPGFAIAEVIVASLLLHSMVEAKDRAGVIDGWNVHYDESGGWRFKGVTASGGHILQNGDMQLRIDVRLYRPDGGAKALESVVHDWMESMGGDSRPEYSLRSKGKDDLPAFLSSWKIDGHRAEYHTYALATEDSAVILLGRYAVKNETPVSPKKTRFDNDGWVRTETRKRVLTSLLDIPSKLNIRAAEPVSDTAAMAALKGSWVSALYAIDCDSGAGYWEKGCTILEFDGQGRFWASKRSMVTALNASGELVSGSSEICKWEGRYCVVGGTLILASPNRLQQELFRMEGGGFHLGTMAYSRNDEGSKGAGPGKGR